MKTKLSDYVWEFVAQQGVRDVFMFPGGGAMHLVDSLGRCEKLNYIPLLHEQACAMAAETYSRVAYQTGVILVTTGPGGTNAITGVAAAWAESTPMLVISGQVKLADMKDGLGVRQNGNQEIEIVDIVKSITKYAVTVRDPGQIRYHLQRAFYEAYRGRPGPVWLDIPLDVQAAMIDTGSLRSFEASQAPAGLPPAQDVQYTVEMLGRASKPLVIAGQGIMRDPNGRKAFRQVVEQLGVPVITSWMAAELLPWDHPLNFGKPGMVAPRYSNRAMQSADLVIAIGTRLDPAMIGYDPADFAPKAKKIIVDVDPCEINKFRFPIERKVVCDATRFLNALAVATRSHTAGGWDFAPWVRECAAWKEKYPVVLEEYRHQQELVNPYHFIDKLSDLLGDEDVIIPGSSGATIDVFWLCLKNREKQRALSTGALGSMGYGIPAAIGACIANGKKRTISVEGDGSLQLNIQELADIAGKALPIKMFILDNGGYLSIMNMQHNHFQGRFVGAEPNSGLDIPDICKVARAYGIETFEITGHDGMEKIIRQALAADGPSLCRVALRNDIVVQPKVVSRVTPDGSMASGSLSHLWPFIDEE